jgi:hypothetical protein
MIVNVEFVDKVTLRQAYLGAVGWVTSTNIITLIIHKSSSLPLPTHSSYHHHAELLQWNQLTTQCCGTQFVVRFNMKLHFKSWIFPSLTVDLYMCSVNKQQHKTKHVGKNKRNCHSYRSKKLCVSTRSPADPNHHGTQILKDILSGAQYPKIYNTVF